MQGVDIINLLKKSNEKCPILSISADVSIYTKNIVMEAGATAYITKPIDIDIFLETVFENL